MKTIVYVDGFNLYYRALKKTGFKWLNLKDLCQTCLPVEHVIAEINYYTARVNHKINPSAPRDQQLYFNALQSTNIVKIHLGSFKIREKIAKIKEPLEFKPPSRVCNITPSPRFVKILTPEEKGSDVKLGAHLIRDAFLKKFDHAVVITNDVDLAEPIRIVKEELGLGITLLKPCVQPLDTLDKYATNLIHIEPHHLQASLFPNEIIKANGGKIIKPSDW